MYEEDLETAIKVVIVGNGAVGKSSMIQLYCKGIYTDEYKKTIGVDFLEKPIQVNGEDVRLMLWDTAGQEEFDAITKAYYRGAQACVLTFSTTDRASFEAVETWKEKVEDEVGEIAMVMVQNKIDLLDDAVITMEEAEDLAKKLRLRFYRTSVKDNLNIQEVFHYIANIYLSQVSLVINSDKLPQTIGPALTDTNSRVNNNNNNNLKQQQQQLRRHLNQFKLRDTITLRTNKRKNSNKKSQFVNQKCALT